METEIQFSFKNRYSAILREGWDTDIQGSFKIRWGRAILTGDMETYLKYILERRWGDKYIMQFV